MRFLIFLSFLLFPIFYVSCNNKKKSDVYLEKKIQKHQFDSLSIDSLQFMNKKEERGFDVFVEKCYLYKLPDSTTEIIDSFSLNDSYNPIKFFKGFVLVNYNKDGTNKLGWVTVFSLNTIFYTPPKNYTTLKSK